MQKLYLHFVSIIVDLFRPNCERDSRRSEVGQPLRHVGHGRLVVVGNGIGNESQQHVAGVESNPRLSQNPSRRQINPAYKNLHGTSSSQAGHETTGFSGKKEA